MDSMVHSSGFKVQGGKHAKFEPKKLSFIIYGKNLPIPVAGLIVTA